MFVQRTARPEKGNKYYVTRNAGGYSPCIKGSPTDADCDVLANCVGYAVGRFNEIVGKGNCNLLASVDAGNMAVIAKQQGLKIVQYPCVGGCMVWTKKGGAGHVAIVEQLNPDGSVITSESGYGAKNPWWLQTRRVGDGRWGQSSEYSYVGCIVNPSESLQQPPEREEEEVVVPTPTLKKGARNDAVKWLQTQLAERGYLRGSEIDGDFGKITLGAVLAFQFENGLTVDGIVGPATKKALVS